MAKLFNAPPQFTKEKAYERFKNELLAWKRITEVKKEKQGILVALSLPDDAECGIRERVFDEVSLDDLEKENGLDTLIEFLDKHLGKDDLADSLLKFEDFEEFIKEDEQSMTEFISKFDQKYNKISQDVFHLI